MLLVFYGLTLEVGQRTREYLKGRGFRVINKVIHEDDATPVKSYFVERRLTTKEEIEACDFKYRTNYGYVGFNNSDIFDAIYGRENAMLAMTSDNVEFFRHIKAGYGDAVPIIGTYIDKTALDSLVRSHTNMSEAEREKRLGTGVTVSKVIKENRHLFDEILLFGGGESDFDYEAIDSQLDAFIERAEEKQKRFLDKNYIEAPYQGSESYVFLSYSHKDRKTANELLAFLQWNGVRVWYDAGIPAGDNWMNVIADKISRAGAVILLSGENSVGSVHVATEIQAALGAGKRMIRINLDSAKFAPGIEMYFYGLNQLEYKTLSYENKNALLESLRSLGVMSDGKAEEVLL